MMKFQVIADSMTVYVHFFFFFYTFTSTELQLLNDLCRFDAFDHIIGSFFFKSNIHFNMITV